MIHHRGTEDTENKYLFPDRQAAIREKLPP